MVANTKIGDASNERDERVFLYNVPWEDYERLVALRGESSVPRLTYLDGDLELMSPGRSHELDKKKLARLLEAYADELELWLEGVGSWTVRRASKRGGAEADECYTVGRSARDAEAPDLVVEVVHSSGGLSRLDVWQRLGAREVWFWIEQRLQIHVRHGDAWDEMPRSALLPDIDPALLEKLMAEPDQRDAVRSLRAALRG